MRLNNTYKAIRNAEVMRSYNPLKEENDLRGYDIYFQPSKQNMSPVLVAQINEEGHIKITPIYEDKIKKYAKENNIDLKTYSDLTAAVYGVFKENHGKIIVVYREGNPYNPEYSEPLDVIVTRH